MSKCTVLRIGSLRNHNVIFCPEKNIHLTSISSTALGIVFHNNKLGMGNNNIQIDAFNQCLNSWSKWNLTLIGIITVLKTFAVPKLKYPLTVIERPSEVILKEVETSMFSSLYGLVNQIK